MVFKLVELNTNKNSRSRDWPFLMVFHVGGIAGFLTSLKNRLPSKSTLLRTNISRIEKTFFVADFPLEPKVGHGDLPSRQQGYDFCGRRSQHWWSSQGEGFWSKIGLLFVKTTFGFLLVLIVDSSLIASETWMQFASSVVVVFRVHDVVKVCRVMLLRFCWASIVSGDIGVSRWEIPEKCLQRPTSPSQGSKLQNLWTRRDH